MIKKLIKQLEMDLIYFDTYYQVARKQNNERSMNFYLHMIHDTINELEDLQIASTYVNLFS